MLEPLSIFVNRLYPGQSSITCLPAIGNQPFDALIYDRSVDPPLETKVEITTASYGKDDHLRMEHLNEHGVVCLTGDVERVGRGIKVTAKAVDHAEILKEQFVKVAERASNKLSKSYEGKPILIITINDWLGFYAEGDSDFKALGKFVEAELAPLFLKPVFRSAYILGLAGRVSFPILPATQSQPSISAVARRS